MKSTRRDYTPTAALATLAWMVVIFYFSHQPGGGEDAALPWLHGDIKNLLHIPIFGILAYLIWHSLRVRIRQTARLATTTLTLVLIYALLDEWHQSFIPLRDASLGDVLNDLLGGVTAVWLISRQPPRPARHA